MVCFYVGAEAGKTSKNVISTQPSFKNDVVDSDESTQVQRVRNRDQRSDQQIQEIMRAQASRTERLSWADDIIENNGTVENLEQNVARLHQTYLKFAKR